MAKEDSQLQNFDLPILIQNRSKSGQKTTLERRQEMIENYVKRYGLSIAKKFSKKIAEDYGIGLRQVYKDWDWIKGNFKLEDIRQVKIDLTIIRRRALEEAFLALSSEQDKTKAIQTAMNIAKQFREELEAWGEKEKVADKVNVSGNEPVIINLIEKSVEEIKSERISNKSKADGNP